MNYAALATSQKEDEELSQHLRQKTALRLKKVAIPGTGIAVYCDTVTGVQRLFIPADRFRISSLFDSPGNKSNDQARSTALRVTIHEKRLS